MPAVDLRTTDDLARALRDLRRRHSRARGGAALTYREIAAATGWSHGIIGEYLAGRVLPPTDRLDVLVQLFGATPAEQRALATGRDLIEEQRRNTRPTTTSGVPRQLPADVYAFAGRTDQLTALDTLLGPDPSTAAVISAIAGTAGVGKTALAVHWAHRVAGHFPDGQLYVDLRGYDPGPAVTPETALAGFLRGLGVDAAGIPAELADRAALFRTVLADRRVLILLDNASSADQVRPLLPGTPGSLALVTSRDALAGLVARDGARRVALDVLSPAEATDLLRTLIGARVDEDPAAAQSLALRCARLPLALRIVAEFASMNPAVPLADIAAHLDDERRRLDLLDVPGDTRTAVRSAFSWSYRHLSAGGRDAFDRIGLHPGRYLDAYALAALCAVDIRTARALVMELERAHLIEPYGAGHTMHDLMRAYAVEGAETRLDPTAQRAALTRLLDHYLGTAAAAMNVLFPYERQIRPEVPAPVTSQPPLENLDHATRWLDEHRANLVAVAGYAASHGWPQHSVDLSRTLWRHFEVSGHYQEALAVHGSAAAAAGGTTPGGDASEPGGPVGGVVGLPAVLTNLGSIHWWLGNHGQALEHLRQALTGYPAQHNLDGRARVLARLALVYERLGSYTEAMSHQREALEAYRQVGNRHGEGTQLLNLGNIYRRLGDYPSAAEHHRLAAAAFVEVGDRRLEGYALGNLGTVECDRGRYETALDYLERSLVHCRESGDRGGEGSALRVIGEVWLRQGRVAPALDQLECALAISREVGDRGLEMEALNTLGEALSAIGRHDAALDRHRTAAGLAEAAGDQFEHAQALAGMGYALASAGRVESAQECWRRALSTYSSLGVPAADRMRTLLSQPSLDAG